MMNEAHTRPTGNTRQVAGTYMPSMMGREGSGVCLPATEDVGVECLSVVVDGLGDVLLGTGDAPYTYIERCGARK